MKDLGEITEKERKTHPEQRVNFTPSGSVPNAFGSGLILFARARFVSGRLQAFPLGKVTPEPVELPGIAEGGT